MTATTVRQTVTTTSRRSIGSAAARRRFRGCAVALAGVANVAVFEAFRAFGTDFTITDPGGARASHTFAAYEILMFSVGFALVGWGTLALLEKLARRRGPIAYAVLAAAVVLLSYVPVFVEVATASTRIGLVVVHTVVGAAFVPVLRRGR